MKKVISMLISVIIILSIIPVTVVAGTKSIVSSDLTDGEIEAEFDRYFVAQYGKAIPTLAIPDEDATAEELFAWYGELLGQTAFWVWNDDEEEGWWLDKLSVAELRAIVDDWYDPDCESYDETAADVVSEYVNAYMDYTQPYFNYDLSSKRSLIEMYIRFPEYAPPGYTPPSSPKEMTEAGRGTCPLELTKPTNATLQWLLGNDSPTTMNFSYTQPAGVTAFIAAKDRAYDEGTEEAFWAAIGYDDVIITTQIDWAIDDPTDWKYNAHPEAWSGRYGFGHIRVGTDEEYEDRFVVSEWDIVDDGWVGSETTREEWIFRGWGYDYEEWADDWAWVGDGEYKPGIRDELKDGQYELTDEGLVIDWEEHTAYVRVRYVVIGLYWNDEGMFEDFYYSDWSDPASYGKDSSKVSIKNTVIQGMRDLSTDIDISEFGLTAEEFRSVFQDIINSVPDLFYINPSYSYYTDSNGIITSIAPSYSVSDASQITRMKTEYKEELDKICSLVDSSWSDVQKVLFLHDYIVSRFEYDTTYTISDAYNLLKEGHGVCQAYTMLYIALLERFGITSDAVTSTDMNHTWNRVKINDKWYHVDVTWDDPTPDRLGMVSHTYFLVSDSFITSSTDSRRPHYNWVGYSNPDVTCSNTSYDSSIWTDVSSPFVPIENTWYFINTSPTGFALMKTSNLKTSSSVKELSERWGTGTAGYYWTGYFSGLVGLNNTLIYNTPREVVSYNPATGSTVTLFRLPDEENDIYGITYLDTLYYAVQTRPNVEPNYIATLNIDIHTHIPGEVIKENIIDATCVSTGSYEEVVYCSVCREEISRTRKLLNALGHSFGEWVDTESPTCIVGCVEERICSRCNATETRGTDPLGHDFSNWEISIPASCTEAGLETRVCTRCGTTDKRTVEAIGHKYVDIVTEPTCIEFGYTTHTCSVCGNVIIDEETSPLGHSFGDWSIVTAPTCERDGYAVRYCSRCLTFERKALDAFGHNNVETVTPPTCTEQGYTTFTCTICGNSYKDCFVDALGHDWDKGEVTLEPTENKEGVRTFTCSRCGATKTEAIPAIITPSHIPGDINGDGVVNSKDLTRLLKYVSGGDVTVNEKALDVNGDGVVNSKDLTRLLKFLSGVDVVIF